MTTPRSLLIAHRGATGVDEPTLHRVVGSLAKPRLAWVDDHRQARACVAQLAPQIERLAVAGGSGTFRAAIEGLVDADRLAEVTVLPLRLGSGNVIARRFGHGARPEGWASNLMPLPVLRCRSEDPGGRPWTGHAVGLVGLGSLARGPDDVARFRPLLRRLPVALRERCNAWAYRASFARRSWHQTPLPVCVEVAGERHELPMLAGLITTGPLPELPVTPRADHLSLALLARAKIRDLVALARRRVTPISWRTELPLVPSLALALTWRSLEPQLVFLDEDPHWLRGSLKIELAGFARVVAGGAS